jgi:hypothetical protein
MNTTILRRRSESVTSLESSAGRRLPTVSTVLIAVNRHATGLVAMGNAAERTLPAPAILALLVYYYAQNVLASQDIERAFARNAHLRLASLDTFPDCRQLRRFRRVNHRTISECLAEVLAGWGEVSSGRSETFSAEAERRVTEAVLLDHALADE